MIEKSEVDKSVSEILISCIYADECAKEYVKKMIYNVLVKEKYVDQKTMEKFFAFKNLSANDKFSIIMYKYKNLYDKNAFLEFVKKYDLDKMKKNGDNYKFVITKEEVESIYLEENIELTYKDKLKIVTQKIYSKYKGYGVLDDLMYMNVDGISGGVNLETNKSIWVFFKGKQIHLSFLSFDYAEDLIRICMNLYRYKATRQLSKNTGYVINRLKDGSRVVVIRPDLSEGWMFFIRKFSNIQTKDSILESENTKKLLKYLVRGSRNIVVTGEQGSGKTTLLLELVGEIYNTYPIRIFENNFEMDSRKKYPNKNICSFQETENIKLFEAIDISKKTDGAVLIVGEVYTDKIATAVIQITQVASKFTMYTHHAKTFISLVSSLRNSLVNNGLFKDEKNAEAEVLSSIDFNIHLEKNFEGERYISRITEIYEEKGQRVYEDIFLKGSDKKMKLSEFNIKNIQKNLSKEDLKEFKLFVGKL